jgi:lipopolysaccharide transport system ATP-binding protein
VSASDVVARARDLGKRYEIYERPHHRLLRQLWPRARHLGREFWALRGVSFEIRRGETVGIIGRNGSGKSTLLQVICGTLPATEGTVEINGRVAALLELGAGFNPEFTGIENVILNASILGLSREEIDARMDAILAFAGIGDFAWQPVKHYSSGMFLRLAFAVAAHVDADILVIDEALAVGDILFTQKCMRFLRRFREEGTLLFVSHDIGMVTGLCDRAIWLERGEMQMSGDVKSVTHAYLEHTYASQQEVAPVAGGDFRPAPRPTEPFGEDVRRDLLLHSNLRNDLRVPPFDGLAEGFGTGGARITHVGFSDPDGRNLAWVVGGEPLTLEVRFLAEQEIHGAIIGFMIKDRVGQVLFGENTYLTYRDAAPHLNAGDAGVARFLFRMPYLPTGDYVVTVSVTEGTQENHILHHWMHEALVFSCDASHMVFGLMGVPMASIEMDVEPGGSASSRVPAEA